MGPAVMEARRSIRPRMHSNLTTQGLGPSLEFKMNMQQARRKAQQGFTLIELMIVVAIIGILAAVAIPQYQDYTKKAKVGNALTAVDSLKTAVALCAQEAGGVLTDCSTGSNGINTFTPTKEVASATVAAGVITATLGTGIGTNLDGKTLTFTPTTAAGSTNLTWAVTTNISTSDEKVITDQISKNNKS